jgi:hypothetical protein
MAAVFIRRVRDRLSFTGIGRSFCCRFGLNSPSGPVAPRYDLPAFTHYKATWVPMGGINQTN